MESPKELEWEAEPCDHLIKFFTPPLPGDEQTLQCPEVSSWSFLLILCLGATSDSYTSPLTAKTLILPVVITGLLQSSTPLTPLTLAGQYDTHVASLPIKKRPSFFLLWSGGLTAKSPEPPMGRFFQLCHTALFFGALNIQPGTRHRASIGFTRTRATLALFLSWNHQAWILPHP